MVLDEVIKAVGLFSCFGGIFFVFTLVYYWAACGSNERDDSLITAKMILIALSTIVAVVVLIVIALCLGDEYSKYLLIFLVSFMFIGTYGGSLWLAYKVYRKEALNGKR